MNRILNTDIFKCPGCHSAGLIFNGDDIFCKSCGSHYSRKKDKFIFIDAGHAEITDPMDRIKFRLKKFGRLYNFMIWLISPVFTYNHTRRFIRKYISGKQVTALNIGSGSSRLSQDIINIDIIDYEEVDIVCDITSLPFENESIDCVLNIAVLEHLPEPAIVVDEIHRVLKHDGMLLCYIPFIVGFHASPHDYSRMTFEGMKYLFRNFNIIELNVGGGPTSGLLWIFQEWFAIALSFG